jgi:dTDP-4-dehydrorhamnose reductase
MKRILILGGAGMLGHKAFQVLSADCDVYATFRKFEHRLKSTRLFELSKVIDGVDVFQIGSVKQAIERIRPDVVHNCVGIVKQHEQASDPKFAIYINALFPHLLSESCSSSGSKLVHISTDCVFSGRKGDYTEDDMSDAEDMYGRTKYLGEVRDGRSLTLRTSIIGRELFSSFGLVEWFLSQEHRTVPGYTNAIYTGLTTMALCREIQRVIHHFPNLYGLYHVSSEPITKYHLLSLVKKAYHADVEVNEFPDFYCDRSLDSARFREATNSALPKWEQMIVEMHDDSTPYSDWRTNGLRR